MIGRQRDPRRTHLEQHKYGEATGGRQGRILYGEDADRRIRGTRHYRVHIMDIAHPDVDGVAEHLPLDISGASISSAATALLPLAFGPRPPLFRPLFSTRLPAACRL
jgi:hypothetical protein